MFSFVVTDKLRMHFDETVENIKKFMINRKIPLNLQNRVNAYFEYEWANLKGLNEKKVRKFYFIYFFWIDLILYGALPLTLALGR